MGYRRNAIFRETEAEKNEYRIVTLTRKGVGVKGFWVLHGLESFVSPYRTHGVTIGISK
jgi:hypothetical protein